MQRVGRICREESACSLCSDKRGTHLFLTMPPLLGWTTWNTKGFPMERKRKNAGERGRKDKHLIKSCVVSKHSCSLVWASRLHSLRNEAMAEVAALTVCNKYSLSLVTRPAPETCLHPAPQLEFFIFHQGRPKL